MLRTLRVGMVALCALCACHSAATLTPLPVQVPASAGATVSVADPGQMRGVDWFLQQVASGDSVESESTKDGQAAARRAALTGDVALLQRDASNLSASEHAARFVALLDTYAGTQPLGGSRVYFSRGAGATPMQELFEALPGPKVWPELIKLLRTNAATPHGPKDVAFRLLASALAARCVGPRRDSRRASIVPKRSARCDRIGEQAFTPAGRA